MEILPEDFPVKHALRVMAEDHSPGRFGIEAGSLKSFKFAALFSAEAAAPSGVHVPHRRAFHCGRACAHNALRNVEHQAAAVGTRASGEPL